VSRPLLVAADVAARRSVGVWTLAPIPSLDRWVIWRIVMRPGRDDAASPGGE
jgi:hypothetical protein